MKSKPNVIVEIDPSPQFPDVYCSAPMRINNASSENWPVKVVFTETYRTEGCGELKDNNPRTLSYEWILERGETRYLGCGHYRGPSSLCTEIRTWPIVSQTYITSSNASEMEVD